MAYDEAVAGRIREALAGTPNVVEKKMFGGVGFLIRGNMAVGVHRESLLVRVDPAQNDEFLSWPHTRPFDMTGRPMQGWLLVDAAGWQHDDTLAEWIREGVEYALTLPAKKK